ncbi:coth protein-domain-containing protein [Pilaira anomala]|nr:coth protein-domain-containing protein [Pilaira anomala]
MSIILRHKSTHAATVQFNVISPGSKSVQVDVGGNRTALTAPNSAVPFYTGSVEIGTATSYKYVSDSKSEAFSRTLTAGVSNTFNEYYDRPITYANIPTLSRPLDNGKQWTRAAESPDLFDINYMPSIFVQGIQSEMDYLVENVPDSRYKVNITMIGKDYVRTFNHATLRISGAGKPHNNAKQSWRWTLAKGDYIDNRNSFKIRHMEEDPTQMREKLYADCLRAMGTYANQANMVRYFINNEAFGTFNLIDDIAEYSYIRSMFYAGKPPKKMGPLYDGASGAGFQFIPDPYDYGSFKPTKGSPEGSEAIFPLAKAFNQLNITDNLAVSRFEKMFDIDQFLRFMVMEYLGGSWDGYWEMQTNDGAYKDYANKNKWYYLGQDYDGTFGVNNPVDVVNFSYRDYPAKNPDAVLINGFLKNKDLAARFESYIVDTVKQLFNNNTLGKRILAYREFIEPDLKWDRSIKQRSPGIDYGWVFSNTYENLFREVSSPKKTGGGAAYGLIEWIVKKSQFVAKDLKFTL